MSVGRSYGLHKRAISFIIWTSGLRSRCDAFKTLFDGLTPNIRFVVFEYTLEYESIHPPIFDFLLFFKNEDIFSIALNRLFEYVLI